jgi:tetratricopeptide (TPR) repeat protein
MDAADLAARISDESRQGRLRNTVGILEWQRGSYHSALEQYEKALDLFRRAGDQEGEGIIVNSIGVTLHKLDRLEEAALWLRGAVQQHREAASRKMEAHALAALGDVLLDLERRRHDDAAHRRTTEAMDAYAGSLQIRWELNDRRGEGWMLHHIASAHATCGERERASDYARQALVVAHEIQDAGLIDACHALLA